MGAHAEAWGIYVLLELHRVLTSPVLINLQHYAMYCNKPKTHLIQLNKYVGWEKVLSLLAWFSASQNLKALMYWGITLYQRITL